MNEWNFYKGIFCLIASFQMVVLMMILIWNNLTSEKSEFPEVGSTYVHSDSVGKK